MLPIYLIRLSRPKGILQLIIRSKSGHRYSMRLINYEDADALMTAVAMYNEVPVEFYDGAYTEDVEENNEYIKRP